MQNFEKWHFFIQKQKKFFFLFFMGNESPNAHDSKFMIGFVPSAQHPTLQSSKVQNCQNWGKLLRGWHSTFLITLSIFIWIYGFYWKFLLILMFGLHFCLGYFWIKCRNRGGWNGDQTSRSVKIFDEIQRFI